MRSLLVRMRSWWRGVRRTNAVDAEMEEEFQLHMELRAADLQRAGMPAAEATRQARVEFGGTYNYTQQGREARGLAWFDWLRFSWLDFKLGARMIAKNPGLTFMGSLAIGVAIAVGAGVSSAITTIKSPHLPFDEGDRIVGIQMWDVAARNPERRIARDVAGWRANLRSITDVGAFRPTMLNLVGLNGNGEAIRAVEMSASGFRVTRVPPRLGRYLVDDDERPDASPVAVLGYDAWRGRFSSDSTIVGRTIRLGGTLRTVVGVMPEGFAFPVNFSLWVPLRIDSLASEGRTGPVVFAFGRLAKGATLDDARVELATVSTAASHDYPDAHRNLRARVLPYTQSWFELDDPDIVQAFNAAIVIVTLLVVVICVNVATLVYARTASRQTEIAVRSALGASRGRIVAQLFGEACVLAGCGAAIGLGIVSVIGAQLERALWQFGVTVPFWIHADVRPSTLAYLVALSVLGAAIIGVLPALQVTGPRVQLGLQQLVGGHSTIRMGRIWTALILTEVAFAVALLPVAARFTGEWLRVVGVGPGFAAEQYLSATLAMERTVTPNASSPVSAAVFVSRYARSREELLARLEAESDVTGLTYANALPGSEPTSRLDVDRITQLDSARPVPNVWDEEPLRARSARVDRRYFDTFGIPVVAGRGFGPADADSAATAIVVNRAFVALVFQGRNAIGRRVRTVTFYENRPQPSPWYEVVGVVGDFPAEPPFPGVPRAAMYQAANIGRLYPVSLTVRLRTDPRAFAERLRRVTGNVQPELLLRDVAPLEDRIQAQHMPLQWIAVSLAVVTLSVLMLSCAGVYALMSVVVTRRRREIGIRVALGAERRSVLWALFSRAAAQVGVGVATGIAAAALLDEVLARGDMLGSHGLVILAGVAVSMAAFAMLAALAPARIALNIPPTEALKAE